MTVAKNIDLFESKNGTVSMSAHGAQFVITTVQRIRADLVWATESARSTIEEAKELFAKHKECISAYGQCVGDRAFFSK